jgi:hypothetical protein
MTMTTNAVPTTLQSNMPSTARLTDVDKKPTDRVSLRGVEPTEAIKALLRTKPHD